MKVTFPNAKCIKASDKAILVKLEDVEEPVWFPQTHVDEDSEVYEVGHHGDLVVSEWIAAQKGLV